MFLFSPALTSRTGLLRTTGLFAEFGEADLAGHLPKPVPHLPRRQVMKLYPFILRNRDHHPPIGPRDLLGQVVPRDFVGRLRPWTDRIAALTVLNTSYDTKATQKANKAALGSPKVMFSPWSDASNSWRLSLGFGDLCPRS